jgi:hypothetical protein
MKFEMIILVHVHEALAMAPLVLRLASGRQPEDLTLTKDLEYFLFRLRRNDVTFK